LGEDQGGPSAGRGQCVMWEAFDGVRSEWSRACAAMEKQALANAGEIEMTYDRQSATYQSAQYQQRHISQTDIPLRSILPTRSRPRSMKLLNNALRHALLRRRIPSKKPELSATLFDQYLQRLDANPASVCIVMSLLHQSRPWYLVRELACRQQNYIFSTASAYLPR
jgi:hypothetical protein